MKHFIKRIIIGLLLGFLITITMHSDSEAAKRKRKPRKAEISCRSAILSNSTDGKRLFSKNPYIKVQPASTAKVMTALLVLEKLSLDDYIEVRSSAIHVQPSKIDLRPGEKYKVSDLLYAILLNSANDASIVLAEAVAGSERRFVQMMNARAKELGAKDTVFANSNGLPSRSTQHITAYDMYLIFREALKNPFFRRAIKFQYKNIVSANGRQIALRSHNKILFKDWDKKVYGKTGYTRSARACFVGTVEENGDTLIIAVYGCSSNRWNDIKHVVKRYGGVAL